MKNARQQKILEIIAKYDIDTQDTLIKRLAEEGYTVTQTTASRDIKQLNLIKGVTANGTYNICDGLVYTFSLKQNGYAVEVYEAEVEIATVSANASGYAIYDGETVEKANDEFNGTLKVTLTENVDVVVIK